MDHLTEDQIRRHASKTASVEAFNQASEHLRGCELCARRLGDYVWHHLSTNSAFFPQNGHPSSETLQELLETYRPGILLHCRKQLPQQDAEDLVQEIIVKLMTVLPTFAYDPTKKFRAWLNQIVRNACVDFFRRRNRQEQALGGTSNKELLDNAEEQLSSSISQTLNDPHIRQRILLTQAMENVRERRIRNPNRWQAFWLLTYGQDGVQMQATEVAKQLEMSLHAVVVAQREVAQMIQDEVAKMMRADEIPD